MINHIRIKVKPSRGARGARRQCWIALAIGWAAWAAFARAEDGRDVAVLYNSNMPESREVAEHYARRRAVPEDHLIGLALPSTEAMTRQQYIETLRDPFVQALQERKLMRFEDKPDERWVRVTHAKIRYALLCFGVPTKIQPAPGLIEAGTEQLQVELKRNEAAVDSELSCLPLGPYALTGIITNRFYKGKVAGLMQPTNGLLMVTRLDGPSAAIAKGLVDLALVAETNGLWGRAYIDARGLREGPYIMGDQWIVSTAYVCEKTGFETEVDRNPETFPASFPLSHVAFYVGWYDWNVSGPFARPKIEFMPGAFAYHLHSFSAETIRTTNQHWVGPLLAKGATATMGCVYEPYLTGTPDMSAFFGSFLFGGFSFGEAAAVSQAALSWQDIAVGDPLYRPFAMKHAERHAQLLERKSELLEWSYLADLIIKMKQSPGGLSLDGALRYLDKLDLTRRSPVLSEKRAGLYKESGRLSDAIDAYEDTLKLNPSPEQQKRVMLQLGELSRYYGRSREAFEIYEKFVKQFPDYAGAGAIYSNLVALANDLKRPELAQRFEAELKRLATP